MKNSMLTFLFVRPPANLADIITHLNINIGHSTTARSGTRFRVRNVDTLEDYGIYKVADFGSDGRPLWFKAIRLDSLLTETKLRGDFNRYALLSPNDEVEYMSGIVFDLYSSLMASSYREGSLAGSPCA